MLATDQAEGLAQAALDRGRLQGLAPVLNPLFQRALAPIRKLLEVDLLEDPEGESFRAHGMVQADWSARFVSTPWRSANERRLQIVERSGAAPTHSASVAAHRTA